MPFALITNMIEEYSSMMNTDKDKDDKKEINLSGAVNIPGLKIKK